MPKAKNKFRIKHEFLLFITALIVTIAISRLLVYYWRDPNLFIGALELHHFYYGLILLIITQLAVLFGKIHPKITIISSAIAIGLILDESLFIMPKVRGPTTYSSTLFSATTLTFLIIVVIGVILFDFVGRFKKKK